MNRRNFTRMLTLGIAARPFLLGGAARAEEPLKEVRIGYQKTSQLLVVKAQKLLEKRFEPEGVTVKWFEFPFGPPLLEAVNAGSVDFGYTGDAPPVFAQAAHANILYVGAIPTRGNGQSIIVLPNSPIKTLEDLRGKKIGVAKGSSAHNLLVAALESAHVDWNEITPVYLAPADAASAFSRGAIDAWSIWDPFYAIAELKQDARPLPIDPKATEQNFFLLANGDFAARHPAALSAINEEVARASAWSTDHRDETAALFSEASGVDLAAQKRAVAREDFAYGPLDDKVIAAQQATADRFARIGLIPRKINVRDIVWSPKAPS